MHHDPGSELRQVHPHLERLMPNIVLAHAAVPQQDDDKEPGSKTLMKIRELEVKLTKRTDF